MHPLTGMMPMQQQQQQQQGFPMVPVMQPNMQGMIGMNFGSQLPPGAMPMQGGMAMGPMPSAGMPYMPQHAYMGMRPPPPQYTPDMQKQFAEEQKRFEQQQRMMEEDRKRRQFEEQKQKLRLLSSVKPKSGEKNRDDALEAIKGNLAGFSRDAKMHPGPTSHPSKSDAPQTPLSAVPPSQSPAFPDDEEFSDFIQGPESTAPAVAAGFLPFHPTSQAVPQSNPPMATAQPVTSTHSPSVNPLYAATGLSAQNSQGPSLEEKMFASCDLSAPKQAHVVFNKPQPQASIGCKASVSPQFQPSVKACNWAVQNENLRGVFARETPKEPEPAPDMSAKESGVGVFPPQDALHPMLPAWIFNDGLVPELYKKVLEFTITPAGIDTGKLYPILLSSGLPRETLGQIWALANRATPGKLTKEELYTVLAMIAMCDDDDDFQDFQEAPKSSAADDSFTAFKSEAPGTLPKAPGSQTRISAPTLLTPISGTSASSSVDKYAVFKDLTEDKPSENTSFADFGDKYSVFRQLDHGMENKSSGEGFAEFKSAVNDDGFTDFKTADSISPLEPSEQAKTFTAAFPPVPFLQQPPQQPALQPKDAFNLTDLFTSVSSSGESKPVPFPPVSVTSSIVSSVCVTSSLSPSLSSGACTSTGGKAAGGADDFGDFNLFGAATSASSGGGWGQDEFADFIAFGSAGKKNDDDFPAAKFPPAFSTSDKAFIDKLSAFKQAKEDSASVKSLDLPSIGGSSVGKEDSEDAISGQFDMKSAEVGGDLKHVLSDSSLDLPPVIGQQPPIPDLDDFKFDPFGNFSNGSALSSLTSYDWSEKECPGTQSKKQPPAFFLNSESRSSSCTSVLQKKETSFGSSENVTMTTVSKVTTFSAEEASSENKFPALGDARETDEWAKEKTQEGDDFGDFTSISSSGAEPIAAKPNGTELCVPPECFDEFGEFQSEKPKISKLDFLLAGSQAKVKSSEEMIKSELATFDLSVQGSHKRSLSLGDKEVIRTSAASEQPFRDRSNTLNEKPAPLPVIRDKYKDLTGEVEENERYAYEWQRCLESALQVIKKAGDTLNGISSSTVCSEVIQSTQGMEYLLGVIEVYRVTKRVEIGIKATAVCNEKLQHLMKEIEKIWSNLVVFMSLTPLTPDENSLDFSSCILRPGIKNAKDLACGVCLLNVDSRSKVGTTPHVLLIFRLLFLLLNHWLQIEPVKHILCPIMQI
uniref:Synergin gamma n=1 Tax=Callorhinchus milii TaxID=7868 RepID=A0A4W3IGM9_CALMI